MEAGQEVQRRRRRSLPADHQPEGLVGSFHQGNGLPSGAAERNLVDVHHLIPGPQPAAHHVRFAPFFDLLGETTEPHMSCSGYCAHSAEPNTTGASGPHSANLKVSCKQAGRVSCSHALHTHHPACAQRNLRNVSGRDERTWFPSKSHYPMAPMTPTSSYHQLLKSTQSFFIPL